MEWSKRDGIPTMTEQKVAGMTLSAVRDCLHCDVLAGDDRLDTMVDSVAASDGMSAVLAALCRRALLVTGLANIQSVRTAHVADLAAILYVRGVRPCDKTIAMAREKRIVLLSTTHNMFDSCGILHRQGLRGVT